MSTPSIVAIINPKSGSSSDKFRDEIEAALKSHGADFEIRETDPEDGAKSVVRDAICSGVKHIIACGGDGTIMSAVNAMAKVEEKPQTLFSIIPGGTANLLAQALNIPQDVEKAVEIALKGRDKLIDLGQCGDTFFALGLGMGLTEKLVSGASSKEKETLGRLAYLKAMLAELGQKPNRFSFQLDKGEKQRAVGVALVVANAGEISGKWKFAPNAEMDDGLLDLCILHRFYFRDLLRLLGRALLGNLPDDRAVSFFQAKSIQIESVPPLDLQIDGEEVDTKPPLSIRVVPKALLVRVGHEEK
jgi:diacylglycerol kinase (ATP)